MKITIGPKPMPKSFPFTGPEIQKMDGVFEPEGMEDRRIIHTDSQSLRIYIDTKFDNVSDVPDPWYGEEERYRRAEPLTITFANS